MRDRDKSEQDLAMESRMIRKRYFELHSERLITLEDWDDIADSDDFTNSEDEEAPAELSLPTDERGRDSSDKEFMQSETQTMVEYYHLAFRAIKTEQYLIAALSLVQYLQKIFLWSDYITRDKASNLFSGDNDSCPLIWIGNRNELRELIKKLEYNDYVEELSGHKVILKYLDCEHEATEEASFESSLN